MNKTEKPPVNWADIKLIIFDCDGVLTDGKIIHGGENLDIKSFHAHDGLGFNLLQMAKIVSAIITGRSSDALIRRCKDLQISNFCQGAAKKLFAAQKLLNKYRFKWSEVVYMGDDWNDIPVMQKVAFAVCPADAMPEIKELSDMVTERKSGDGAARELIDYVLYQKGIYEQVVEKYLKEITTKSEI